MFTLSATLKLVIHKTLPLTLGLFAIMLVQLVDSIFIGLLGVDELAVHGITLPFQTALIGVQVGIGIAATTLISQAKGAQQHDKSATMATIALIFGLGFIILICSMLFVFGELIFAAFLPTKDGAEQVTVLRLIFQQYWPVWLLSSVSVAALYLVTCIYRANGDTKTTGTMFVVASFINLVLDPLLIFSFKMGITGAAVASIIGYAVSTLYMLFKVRHKFWFARVLRFEPSLNYLFELLRLGISTTANQILPATSAFICMMLIARMGTEIIAFWSLLSRIESFLLMFTLALTMSLPPILGHYLGAHEHEKINDLLNTTVKLLLGSHLGMALILSLSLETALPLAQQQADIQSWLETALWILPYSYGPLGLCMLMVSAFNALGLPQKALGLSFIRLFILYIPAIWIGSTTGNIMHIVIAAMLANLLAGVVAWLKLKQYLQASIPRRDYIAVN